MSRLLVFLFSSCCYWLRTAVNTIPSSFVGGASKTYFCLYRKRLDRGKSTPGDDIMSSPGPKWIFFFEYDQFQGCVESSGVFRVKYRKRYSSFEYFESSMESCTQALSILSRVWKVVLKL